MHKGLAKSIFLYKGIYNQYYAHMHGGGSESLQDYVHTCYLKGPIMDQLAKFFIRKLKQPIIETV